MPVPLLGLGVGAAIRGAGRALLKNAVKRAKKTPNKEFKNINLKPRADGTKVKGSVGKKNFINEIKKNDRAHENMQIGKYEKLRGAK
jgi:hypothetical protein